MNTTQKAEFIEKTGYIDPYFTFENFVVSSGSEVAYGACSVIAERPGDVFNPLIICGKVGLGKTHLIHAVANRLLHRNHFNVAYRSSENFTDELILSIRNDATDQFRNHYRLTDLLIIDDIQRVAGKASTQAELFDTINALSAARKQIILTSDRPLCEIKHLKKRLKSRFNSGLSVNIKPPSFEARMVIITNRAERAGIKLPKNVMALLANHFSGDVRKLEGALTRLVAHSALTGSTIDLDVAKRLLHKKTGMEKAEGRQA